MSRFQAAVRRRFRGKTPSDYRLGHAATLFYNAMAGEDHSENVAMRAVECFQGIVESGELESADVARYLVRRLAERHKQEAMALEQVADLLDEEVAEWDLAALEREVRARRGVA